MIDLTSMKISYKAMMKIANKGYIFEDDGDYCKESQEVHSSLPFLLERMKIDICKNLCVICMTRKNMSQKKP